MKRGQIEIYIGLVREVTDNAVVIEVQYCSRDMATETATVSRQAFAAIPEVGDTVECRVISTGIITSKAQTAHVDELQNALQQLLKTKQV